MRLYSYVVARDYGFAPNPFFGFCTLATCKPIIRRVAKVGDWILGTGSAKSGLEGRAVYAMRVAETMTYNEYWNNPRFQCKKPNLRGSQKQAFGDNIYYHEADCWRQADSHHSFPGGRANKRNIEKDTSVDKILTSNDYIYWGRCGPIIPSELRDWGGFDVCATTQGHKSRFPKALVDAFVYWIRSFAQSGYLADPYEWSRSA